MLSKAEIRYLLQDDAMLERLKLQLLLLSEEEAAAALEVLTAQADSAVACTEDVPGSEAQPAQCSSMPDLR